VRYKVNSDKQNRDNHQLPLSKNYYTIKISILMGSAERFKSLLRSAYNDSHKN
jgi:hypothetical protein